MAKCDHEGCLEDARSYVEWGTEDRHGENLCGRHIEFMWDLYGDKVKAGQCWWTQRPPEEK